MDFFLSRWCFSSARFAATLCALGASLVISGCGVIREKPPEEGDHEIIELVKKPISPEKSGELLKQTGGNWFYGQGIGETAVNVGTSVVFPPYAIYYLGNMALSVAGYEPLYVTNALPEDSRDAVNGVYSGVTSAPGRLTAAVAGEEFRTKPAARARIKEVLKSAQTESAETGSQVEK